MNSSDSYNLLRECSAGLKTAVASIDDVLPYVKEKEMKQILQESKRDHKILEKTVDAELEKMGADSKEPNVFAKGMSKVKINTELTFNPTKAQAASLITDGCDMGVKSINKYLNQYPAASDSIKQLANQLCRLEETLEDQLRSYL